MLKHQHQLPKLLTTWWCFEIATYWACMTARGLSHVDATHRLLNECELQVDFTYSIIILALTPWSFNLWNNQHSNTCWLAHIHSLFTLSCRQRVVYLDQLCITVWAVHFCWITKIKKYNIYNLYNRFNFMRPFSELWWDVDCIRQSHGIKRSSRRSSLQFEVVDYRPHTNSRLISMILFIYFPGEPMIIIAFGANPISQLLILHHSIPFASNSPVLCLYHFQLEQCIENKPTRRKIWQDEVIQGSDRSHEKRIKAKNKETPTA